MQGRDFSAELFGSAPDQGSTGADFSAELFGPPPPPPEGGFIPAVQRGFLQTGILMGDILPAMAGRLFGANEYAERQFREAAETERKIAEKYAPAVASYKDIKGVGDAVTYAVESVGELIPSILPSLFTGGVAGVVGRGAVIAAKEAAEAAARKQIAEKGAQALAQKEVADQIRNAGIEAARRTALKYDAVGIVAGSSLQNIPEVYKNIKDETEQESLGTAILFGGFNSLLDAALPLSVLTKLRKAGIPEEQVVGEWYKRFGKGASKGFAAEGATEAAQEMSSAAAEKFVDENQEFFSEKNLERFLNAGLKGGLGGGVMSGTMDVALGKRSLTENLKPLDEDIRDTQSDILARRAFLDELRTKAAEEGKNKLDPEALKDLGFREKHTLYETLVNKDINDPAQAGEVVATLESAINDESIKGQERKAVNDALSVINEYLQTRAEPDVGPTISEPSGAGVGAVAPPVTPPTAEGVGEPQRTGVVPPVADVGVPVGGEGVAAAPVAPPVAASIAAPVAAPAPVAPPVQMQPVEPPVPTTRELITQQEAELSKQMEKFQSLLQEQVRRYGLKDVAVKVDADLKNASGEYSKGLIKLAVDAVDPVRDLRHESIHALKELGFFTPAQWDALVRQAKSSWINTYMQNRNIDGNFIEPGQETRYDAYMREFKEKQGMDDAQAQEALIEEAIADAFGDFSKTKAPPGMMQAILRRMREFFQSIKEALGGAGITDPERIFGKIEKAELAPAKVAAKPEAKPAVEEKPAPVETKAPEAVPPAEEAAPEEPSEKYTIRPTPAKEVQEAKIYEKQNGILPYTSEGQLDVPRAKYSIKREGKYANHPLFDIPLNKNGTVTLYYPTTNETARQVIQDKKLFGATPTSNRVYLTNESSGPKVMNSPGNIDQPMNGANILFQVDPDLLQLDMEHPDGRKDFFIPIAEGEAFAQKMAMSKLFTLNAPRAKALSKDTKLTDLERRITDGINQYLELDTAAQRERLKQAKDLLKREHNVTTLLGENGKLEKTRIGDYGLTYEGKGVSSLGLGLASAQRINEQNLSTCPKSAICEGLCLGETSGQNLLYGGEGQFKSGPRLSQYLKTEAMVLHPEDFAIALHDEIKKFARNTKRDDMQPAIRLNVTSDFRPQTWGAIMGAFPDVMFYDYTKLPTKPAAPNHHLTYSSTGVSQIVGGKTIINPETNWDKMVQQMLEGNNVAMAFTSRKSMPEFVIDERTGERFQVWNGDNYDARFLDPKPGEPGNRLGRGMIIGLTNKDKTTNPNQAAEKYKGFFVDYDPARDGKTLTIPNQKNLTSGKAISIIRPEVKASLRSPETKEFKQFLAGSKAVDSDGLAIPYFHATLRDVFAFKGDKSGAIFFSPDPEFSNAYFAQKLREAAQRPGEYLTPAEIRGAVRLVREYVYENYGRQSKTSKEMLESISEIEAEGKKTGVYRFTGELGDVWAGNTDQMGAVEKSIKTGRNIMPVYINTKNPFDYEDKDQVAKVLKQMMLDPSVKERYGFDPAPGGADLQAPENFMLRKTLERSEKDYAAAVRDRYREPILDGDWKTIELPEVQTAIKKLHDGFYVSEEGMYGDPVKNLAVYSSKQIKSATGNVGAYGQRPPTEEEAQRVGMTAEEGQKAQEAGDVRFSLRAVRYSPERFDSVYDTSMYTQNGAEDKTRGYLGFVNPMDFVNATTTPEYLKTLRSEQEPLDFEKMRSLGPIGLNLSVGDDGDWKIVGHEGRHRMLALADKGYDQIPIFMEFRRAIEDAQPFTSKVIPAQIPDAVNSRLVIKDLEPLSYNNRERARERFTQFRPEGKFSLRAPKTPEFKRWFGDSKVVDANGKPLVVYHATNTSFDEFAGEDFPGWFTTSLELAERYLREPSAYSAPNIVPVYLSIKNPLRLDIDMNDSRAEALEVLRSLGFDTDQEFNRGPSAYAVLSSADFQMQIFDRGYDGLFIKEDGADTFAPVLNTQIKSATGNNGDFDPVNPDIRKSLRSSIDPAINARILQTTTEREEKGHIERMTQAIGPESRSRFRAAALNRYNRLGENDKEKIRRMGGAEFLADAGAEPAALMSDLAAGIVAGALGVYDKVGGVPVYNRHYVVEREVVGPRGSQFIQVGGRISTRQAAEALARTIPNSSVKERGYTAVSNQNNTIKGPIAIFAPLAKLGDPYAYRAYQYWAGVKRGSKWITNPNGQVVEQLFNDPTDIQKADRLRQEFLTKYNIDFDQIQKEWIVYNDQLVQYMLDTGVISQRNADKFRQHGDYLPFYRQIDGDDDAVGPRIFQSISAVKAPRKIKGGEDPLGDFLENVVRNTQSAVQAGLKNVAARRAADIGMDLGQVAKITQAQASPVNSFYVLENGEKVYYDSSDMLFIESIKSLGMPAFPGIGLLSAPADVLRNLVTKDPGFMLANMMRDSLAAWTTSGVNMLPIAATLKNFTDAVAGTSPEYKALLMAGVVGGYDYSQGTKDAAKQFGKELRKTAGTKTVGEKALTPFTSLWDGLEKGTQASDAATRIEVYKQTLKDTGNEAEALFRALEVMNFNRKGNNPIVRVATAAIPFLNARMQGLDVLYRAGFGQNATKNAKEIQKTFWVRGMYMAALSTMYWALTHDDDEYKAQEQETRDNNWLFPSLGIRVPIPFEVGVLFKVIPERIAGLTLGNDTAKDFTTSMTRQLVSTLAVNPIPQTILPLVEATTNYSFFTMRPIVGQGIEGVASAYEVGPGTSRMAEALGKSLNISPMKIDQIIQGYTGTIGQYMSDVIDAVYDMHTDNPKASKRFEQLPVVKRFVLDPDARGQVTAYYDLKNSVDEAVRTANLLERSMNWEEWGKYYSENVQMFAFKDYVLDMDKSLKEYRDMKNMIRNLPMDADQKRDSILAITRLENQLNANIQTLKKQMQK